MSAKRQATTELTHENWDQDDPSEHEEMGAFKAAPKDVLEKRVIRTAKRRSQVSGDEPNKSVFSGFGGFNKAPPSSFDFLANLTNGTKANQDQPVSKPATSSPSNSSNTSMTGSLFGMPMTSTPSKSTFGTAGSTFGSVIGKSSASSLFSTTINNAANTMFKGPSTEQKSMEIESTNHGNATTISTSLISVSNQNKNTSEVNDDEKPEDKMIYYSKLKGLNESVLEWIKKHVQVTPLCILSPIFKDYEKYLKEIQDEYHRPEDTMKTSEVLSKDSKKSLDSVSKSASTTSMASEASSEPTIFSGMGQEKKSPFDSKTGAFNIENSETTTAGGLFGTSTAGGLFGTSTAATDSASPFITNSNGNATSPLSFGTGKPFGFNSSVQKSAEETNGDAEDEPPKVEYTPIVEENSVLEKKCKIFFKKDGNFVDKGVGTLYVKKVEGSEKHQLLVRANTTLGNILLNLILSSDTPTQRLGKNNVMMVCIPTPDTKPPPVPVLIRVKTSEEADELLESLNKFRG